MVRHLWINIFPPQATQYSFKLALLAFLEAKPIEFALSFCATTNMIVWTDMTGPTCLQDSLWNTLVAYVVPGAILAAVGSQVPVYFCLACPVVLGFLAPVIFNAGDDAPNALQQHSAAHSSAVSAALIHDLFCIWHRTHHKLLCLLYLLIKRMSTICHWVTIALFKVSCWAMANQHKPNTMNTVLLSTL